ncbi:MAG TPA: metalloenzyme [Roseiflexaceae bacterium]|nr:metalloenzyme [Roseiflexaceae bacterium]
MSLIFIFIDGVGLAPTGPDNPLASADTPALRALLGGPLTIEVTNDQRATTKEQGAFGPSSLVVRPILFKPIDATLGVDGLPQSGTGQTALLAGVNAAELHGRHQPHFPPVALRGLLAERSIFRRVQSRGGRATFANPFGPGYWQAVAARRIRRSASVIAAEGAGLRFRDGEELRSGRAVSWDVTNAAMRAREIDAPLVTPHAAGANLAGLAHDHELVFYESFLPDLAGHGRLTEGKRPTTKQQSSEVDELSSLVVDHSSIERQIHLAMQRLDELIGGAIAAMRAEDSLLVTSDHGNVESIAAPTHTRNPVPLLVVGPAACAFEEVRSIMDLADVIERVAT